MATIALALAMTPVKPAHAAPMDIRGGGELGLLMILLAVKGVQLMVNAARSEMQRPAAAAPIPHSVAPAAPAPDQVSAEAEPPPFNSRRHCDAVGGYEAYLKRTGKLCRLH